VRAYVYHAKQPTWGDDEQPWPSAYKRVATVEVPDAAEDGEACEHAFYVTQHLDGAWPKVRASAGVTAHADHKGTSGPEALHRSTSVGDVVVVDDRAYRCARVGWRRVTEIEVAS
jgi:hypothetical protein